MIKYIGIISLVAFIVMLSGCVESNDKFIVSGPTEGELGIWQKFTIIDQGTENGTVSFKVLWDDGTCCETKSLPARAVVPLKHSWFFPGNYTVKVTGNYSDGDTFTVQKDIEIKE